MAKAEAKAAAEATVEAEAAAGKRKVRAPKVSGIVRIGLYVPGETYEVEAQEAERLIRVKGFTAA